MLPVIKDHFKLTSERIFHEIQGMRNSVETALASKGIDYSKLKTALVPNQFKREAAFVFDSAAINDTWYGYQVFLRVIPLLNKKSNHSILVGDYIDTGAGQDRLFEAMEKSVCLSRDVTFKHSSQFHIVYINNMTRAMISTLDQNLQSYHGYVGYSDTTYSSIFKLYLSLMLVRLCVKHGDVIIQGHEPDRPDEDNINMSALPFEESGYRCKSINADLFGLFLSYKIERPVIRGNERDTEFSLNAVSVYPLPLGEFTVQVDDAKLEYIKRAKEGSAGRAGLESMTAAQLGELISEKISASYIYNMVFDAMHNVTKFNVIIELAHPDNEIRTRLLAALEYQPETKTLRLITLF